jgi:Adaptor complexes medium subunit family
MRGKRVVVRVPVPENVATCKIYCQKGSAKYTPEHSCITWKIRKIAGQKEYILAAEVYLAETGEEASKGSEVMSPTATGKKARRQKVTTGAWTRPPISCSFQVPMFAATGLEVKFLKVLEPKLEYQAVKWVRYLTQSNQTLLTRI